MVEIDGTGSSSPALKPTSTPPTPMPVRSPSLKKAVVLAPETKTERKYFGGTLLSVERIRCV